MKIGTKQAMDPPERVPAALGSGGSVEYGSFWGDLEDRLGFQDGLFDREHVVSVDQELVGPSVVVEEGEGHHSFVVLPLIEFCMNAAFLGVEEQIAVGRRKEIGGHPLHLGGEQVQQPGIEGLRVVALTSEPERVGQPRLGQEVVLLGDQLGDELISKLEGHDVP